jgi:hypothetical protein
MAVRSVTKSDSFALVQKGYLLRHNPRERTSLSLSMNEDRFLHLSITRKKKDFTGLIAVFDVHLCLICGIYDFIDKESAFCP